MTRTLSAGIACITALSLGACTNPAYLNSSGATASSNNTRDGAIIGGLLGATAGLVTSTPGTQGSNALIGAALGAGAGALVGNQLDKQAAALREDLGDERISVTNTGNELVVTMPQDILFATDSTALQPAVQDDLAALAGNLMEYPDGTVEIIGHTDNTGSAEYNEDLSYRRADAVAGQLVGSGVPVSRLQTTGRGEDAPVASNLTDEGRAQNRRVDIVIRPTNV